MKTIISERKEQQARVLDIINAYLARIFVTALSNESAYFPPSLMKNEDMHCRAKSALVDLIIQANNKINKRSNDTCSIVDVAALV